MEWILEFIQDIMQISIGGLTNNLFILSTGVTLLMYLFISNLLGVSFAVVTTGDHPVSWWRSPTADAHVTKTLAIKIIVYTQYRYPLKWLQTLFS